MSHLLPISFVHEGTAYSGIITSLNHHNNSFSLHINNEWVATIDYRDNWVMDGQFMGQTGFIGEYIETYFELI